MAADPNARITLTLLGGWGLRRNEQQLSVGASAQRLLVLLALKGPQRRPFAAGMLWPDVLDELAMRRLRGTIWGLRRQCPGLLQTPEHFIALDPSVTVDADELVHSARRVIDGKVEPDQLAGHLVMLAKPPELLLGWYEDWVLLERDRIGELRIRGLLALVDRLLALGRPDEASEAATAAIELDPLRESSHRALMRIYLAEGNLALARRQIERYREILRAAFGAGEPTKDMLDLVSHLPQKAAVSGRTGSLHAPFRRPSRPSGRRRTASRRPGQYHAEW